MLIHIHNYDSAYVPAMPKARILVHSDSEPVEVELIIDSGADMSMLPLSLLQNIDAERIGKSNLKGVAGVSYVVFIYSVLISIGNGTPFWSEVVGTQHLEEPILGRNILNHYQVLLDGPAATASFSQ